MGMMTKGQKLHGFEILEVSDLGELKAQGIFARHLVTGLEVFHILNDDEENLFAYAFMTPPDDSTGVAHILEHSVLCGSKNYPLKDPFLVLSKQSVKTFLNAMTFPDKTVYPASSMVEADYFNLMSVYGDAVFFPLLEEWTFKQEGHRFEFGDDGKVSIQGVVLNEMRGNYSSFDTIAGDWSLRSLLEGTPYDHDSGGDPADIPALTYQQFLAFHKKYYHPVNCRVFLSGNISTERQLELLQNKFLSHFSFAEKPVQIGSVLAFKKTRVMEVPAPSGVEKDPSRATVMLNWLLPDSTDTVALMEANLVTEILLGHDGAPLSKALIDSGLGEDIAPSSGLETEIKHMCFSVGLRGVARERADDFQALVMETIRNLVSTGISEDEIQTAVRSIDFSNREVRRSGGPFALTLMRRSLRGWIHGCGPESTLRYVPAFEEVKKRLATGPEYLQKLLDSWFLQNNHRSLVSVYPDSNYEKHLDEKLAEAVRHFESSITAERRIELIEQQKRFFDKQKEPDDPELLSLIPHVSRKDLPVVADMIESRIVLSGHVPVLLHEQPTNGIAYADFAIPVDILSFEEYPLLPFFASILTGMGLDGLSWADVSSLSARITGGLGSTLFTSSAVPGTVLPLPLDSSLTGREYLILRVKMLAELSAEALALVFRFFSRADFSDTRRLSDLLLEYRNDLDSSLAPAGHQYAVSRSSCLTGRSKAVDEIWNGLTQVRFIRDLTEKIQDQSFLSRLSLRLSGIREQLFSSGMVINLTGTASVLDSLVPALGAYTGGLPFPRPVADTDMTRLFELVSGDEDLLPVSGGHLFSAGTASTELVSASLQVGFASAVLPSPRYGTPEQSIDIVFGHWLASGLLWEKIRTSGGAYGAFSYPDSLEDIFVLATYRDPSPVKSLSVFREALEIASRTLIDPVSLEKTITGCYSREIQPRSPSDKGFTAFIRVLYGITDEIRFRKIERMLSVSPEDMQNCALRLLSDWPNRRATVFAGKKELKVVKKSDFSGKLVQVTV
jgi:Zn-dependent M16 (insulinase) family peptidase